MAGNTEVQPIKTITPAPKVAILRSRFNPAVTNGLLAGAQKFLEERNVAVEVFEAPGAFELPLMSQTLAKTNKYEGVIALGCVIKGDTAHFEFINLGTTIGLMQAQLATEVPISFGVLTVYTQDQAIARSSNNNENKGIEAAAACYEVIAFKRQVNGN